MSELIQHHTKYKEIHGHDEIMMLSYSEHRLLHNRLRREGKCNIPSSILNRISIAAHRRTEKASNNRKGYDKEYQDRERTSKNFYKTVDKNISHQIQIAHYLTHGTVSISCGFKGENGRKIVRIDIP